MKKRLLGIMLAVVLVVMGTAGCSQKGTADKGKAVNNEATSGEDKGSNDTATGDTVRTKPFKIAVGLSDSGATMFSLMSNNLKAFAKEAGGEVVFEGGVAASADATIAFVENQIAAGVDGILIGPPADSVLPTVKTLCEEAGVYWGICFRNILDEEVKKLVESSDYYVGKSYEDEETSGYQVMANLNNVGAKKVAIISMAKGNTTTDLRETGANRACEELGMEIVAESRDIAQASDATSATESFLTAYSDLDAVFIVGATGAGVHEAVAKAIEDAGRVDNVKMATIDFPDSMSELFEKGVLVTCSGLPSWGYDPYMSFVLLANTCMGTPVSDDKVTLTCSMFDINDKETADKWLNKFGDASTLYYTVDEMKELIKAKNPELTAENLQLKMVEFSRNAVN
jgi:ABC-type sugar transport system substrate-binding protein